MSDLGPYARIYQSIWTDPRFETIIDSDLRLGTWVRLLLLAEAAWPQDAAVPQTISQRALNALETCGLVELKRAGMYRIHGLDAERQRRSEHGREAVKRRWHPDTPSITPSNALSNTQPILAPRPSPSTSSSLSENDVERAVPSGEPLLDALTLALGTFPSKKAIEWADSLVAEYGEDATVRALGWAATTGPVKVISRAQSHLKEQAARRDRAETKRKAAELEQARTDRIASRRTEPGPADPRPLAEIIKGLVP